MKIEKRRVIALLLLFVICSPFALTLREVGKPITQPPTTPDVIFSPYAYEHQNAFFQRGDEQACILEDYIRDIESGEKISLYPYSYFNTFCTLPMGKEESGNVQNGNVSYDFRILNNSLEILSINFYSNKNWCILYQENGYLYEKHTGSGWRFDGENMICELPQEVSFFDPISISGINGCGIVLLSSDDPGLEADIQVYIPTNNGWTMARFVMPDGTETNYIQGYVRRREDQSIRYSTNPSVGTMELCIENQEGHYELYQVSYSENDTLLLTTDGAEIAYESILNWKY